MEILLATTNLHKLREYKDMFKPFKHIELISLHAFGDYQMPEETGITCKENAILKAEHAAKALNQLVLADDSGLFVPALKGLPGVHSRRFAGPDATDSENRQKLLTMMAKLSGDARIAYCECALALASPDGLLKCTEGICEGFIAEKERGRNGFGYDPLFIKNDYDKTFAEMADSIKNRISHRRKAFERFISFFETQLSQCTI